MPKQFQFFFFLSLLINLYISQIYDLDDEMAKLRSLENNPLYNISSKDAEALKFHFQLSQTVYSDPLSKHYFTTIYIGENRIKQTYLIDTASDIMSSKCSSQSGLDNQKQNYIFSQNNTSTNKTFTQIKCDSEICKMLPSEKCSDDKNKNFCTFDSSENKTNGIKGYYVKDIAYLEENHLNFSPFARKKYHSFAIPIGCSTEEYGKYKDILVDGVDGVLGINNSPNSFIGLLYKLKIIKYDMFSLCFGPREGYMSLGEFEIRSHLEREISFVPLINSNTLYQIKVNCLSVGNDTNDININSIATLDTGYTTTYLPEQIYDQFINQFEAYCAKKEGCGKFNNDQNLGYCASFPDRETLYNALYKNWPDIQLHLDNNKTYIWNPSRYFVYHHQNDSRLACLGFAKHNSPNIILGTNFFHGYDIIFDRKGKKLGFVRAECSRRNPFMKRSNFNGFNRFSNGDEDETTTKKKYPFFYNRTEYGIDFIRGPNRELNFSSNFKFINFILLLGSIIILIIVAISVISLLICNKKVGLRYETPDVVIDQDTEPNKNYDDDNY